MANEQAHKQRVVLNSKQRFEIAGLLRAHTERIDDDHVRYTEGWSDERVAQEVGGVNLEHVKRFRREALGELPTVSGRRSNLAALARMERRLERAIANFNALAKTLDMNSLVIDEDDR